MPLRYRTISSLSLLFIYKLRHSDFWKARKICMSNSLIFVVEKINAHFSFTSRYAGSLDCLFLFFLYTHVYFIVSKVCYVNKKIIFYYFSIAMRVDTETSQTVSFIHNLKTIFLDWFIIDSKTKMRNK